VALLVLGVGAAAVACGDGSSGGQSGSAGGRGTAGTPSFGDSPGAVPPQGIYEGCAPGAGLRRCIARLERITAAGFRYVLNYSAWYGNSEQVLAYADGAKAAGIELIWPLNHDAWRGDGELADEYKRLARDCACGDRLELIDFAVRLVAEHPSSWGFYVGDEEPPSEAEEIESLSDAVRRSAPGSPQLYIARPGGALLEPFLSFVEVAGADSYPVGSMDPPVAETAAEISTLTESAGIESAIVLQAFSWSDYGGQMPPRYPTERKMRTMKEAAISAGDPDLILWYSYQDVRRSPSPGRRWRALIRAAFH
jgi:hypothetical protein